MKIGESLPGGVVIIGILPVGCGRRLFLIGAVEPFFPVGERLFRFGCSGFIFRLEFRRVLEDAVDCELFAGSAGARVSVVTDPRLDRRAAPACADEADRHIDVFLKLAAEVESHRAERRGGFRGTAFPARTDDFALDDPRRDIFFRRRVVEADLRIIRLSGFFFPVLGGPETSFAVNGHFHVGLAGCKPDVSDQNVFEHDRFAARCSCDADHIGAARLHRRKYRFPDAVFTGCREHAVRSDSDEDHFAGRGRSADPDRAAALQHHVIAVHLADREFFRHRQSTDGVRCSGFFLLRGGSLGSGLRRNRHLRFFGNRLLTLLLFRHTAGEQERRCECRGQRNPFFHSSTP